MKIITVITIVLSGLLFGCKPPSATDPAASNPPSAIPFQFEFPKDYDGENHCKDLSPFCKWVQSVDYRFDITSPTYAQKSSAGIGKIFAVHDTSWPAYDLPFETLWQAMGVEDLLRPPPPIACGTRNLKVVRVKPPECEYSDGEMSFTGVPFSVQSKDPTNAFTILVPGNVQGRIRVTGGLVTMTFKQGAAPELLAFNQGVSVWSDKISCITITTTFTVIRGFNPMDAQHPIIVFH